MRNIFTGLAVAALGALAVTVAHADGMPRGGSIKDAVAPPACGTSTYNWNGGFVGVQLGSAEFKSTATIEDLLNIGGTREESGFTVGGVLGYNWQKCNTVFGIEAEFSWTDIDRKWGVNLGGLGIPGLGSIFNASSSMDWYGALKMRTGFAFDNLLLYLTGGFAFANIEHRGANTGLLGLPAGIVSFSNADTRWGWVAGTGTEYALTDRITWRSEVTYTRFEDVDFNLNIANVANLKMNAQDEVWMLRTGLNLKF